MTNIKEARNGEHDMSYLRSSLAVLFGCFYLLSGEARQVKEIEDGEMVKVKISSRELTRIAMEGRGRIEKLWGASGILEVQPDKEQGELFVRPSSRAPKVFSFFVRDDSGATFTLVAQQYDIPSQSIILKRVGGKERFPIEEKEGIPLERGVSVFVDAIKELMKGMSKGKTVSGYRYEKENRTVPLWKETNIVLRRTYQGSKFVGETYTLKNTSDVEMILHEQEFMRLGDHVQAVALERLTLASKGTTLLYIVRRQKGRR